MFGDTVFCVLGPRPRGNPGPERRPHYCGRQAGNERETCTCGYVEQTGKKCLHLWAMATYELCGPVTSFEENAAIIRDHLMRDRRPEDPNHRSEPTSDIAIYWGSDLEQLPQLSEMELRGQPFVAPTVGQRPIPAVDRDRQPVDPPSPPVALDRQTADQPNPPAIVNRRSLDHRAKEDGVDRREPASMSDDHPIAPGVPAREPLEPVTAPRSPETRRREISPIGRRNRSPQESGQPQSSPTPDFSQNSRGRLHGIQPLHPYRSSGAKKQASSLRMSTKGKQKMVPPIGAITTERDGFAVSLLHVLLRQHTFKQALQNACNEPNIAADNVFAMLHNFADALESQVLSSYPQMLHTLLGQSTHHPLRS